MVQLAQVEKEAIEICKEVGHFIHTEGSNFDRSRIEQKESFNNLVSYVDKEAELRLVTALEKIIPGSSFLTEEGTGKTSSSEYQWIIDPLDGTTNFLHSLPVFAVSVALTYQHKTVMGIVYEVNRDECFHSSGNIAFCNSREIKVSAVTQLNESLLATGFPYTHFTQKDAYMSIIKDFLDKSHGIRRLGSAAVDLAYVACGRLEGFFEYNLNPWDVAAGAFIVQQAGGVVTDFKGGNDFLFGGELCAGCGVHQDMLEVISNRWK
ncbi:MAG: inositol monophosphatase [Flammeovirgaceae bacterium]|nr:inositol monophosphatase [Flammeovirgaceae bacterium]